MSLVVVGLQHVTLTEPHDLETEEGEYCQDRENHYYVEQPSPWLKRLGRILPGRCYDSSGDAAIFAVGGYSAWRNALAEDGIGATSEEVVTQPDRYSIAPFYELIDFSDCEGVIGPEVARKLAKDFRIQRETVRPRLEERDQWYAMLYDSFQSAFETASEDGMVVFR